MISRAATIFRISQINVAKTKKMFGETEKCFSVIQKHFSVIPTTFSANNQAIEIERLRATVDFDNFLSRSDNFLRG
jgi:hypothetical protein